jgi:hypothetical protein
MEENTTATPPVVTVTPERQYARLCQVTIHADEEIEKVNQALTEGWRLISVGYRPDATVFVLGQLEEKAKRRGSFSFLHSDDE